MKIYIYRNTYMQMFIATLITVAMNYKQTNHPSTSEWINCGILIQRNATQQQKRMDCWYTKQHRWISKHCIGKRSQTQKGTYCIYDTILKNSRKGEIMIKSRAMTAKSWRLERRLNRKECKVTFWSDGNALYFYCGSVYMIVHKS